MNFSQRGLPYFYYLPPEESESNQKKNTNENKQKTKRIAKLNFTVKNSIDFFCLYEDFIRSYVGFVGVVVSVDFDRHQTFFVWIILCVSIEMKTKLISISFFFVLRFVQIVIYLASIEIYTQIDPVVRHRC